MSSIPIVATLVLVAVFLVAVQPERARRKEREKEDAIRERLVRLRDDKNQPDGVRDRAQLDLLRRCEADKWRDAGPEGCKDWKPEWWDEQ